MSVNLCTALLATARSRPELVAWKSGAATVSYGELGQRAVAFGASLERLGVGPGDRVGVMLPNCVEFPVAYHGILHAGAVALLLNPQLKTDEVAFQLGDSGARALICHAAFDAHGRAGRNRSAGCELLIAAGGAKLQDGDLAFEDLESAASGSRSPREIGSDAPAALLYTSGTTGQPKGALLPHLGLLLNAMLVRDMAGYTCGDVLPAALPLFHSFGQTALMNAGFLAGATLVEFPRFDAAQIVASMERDGLTILPGVPTMLEKVLAVAVERGVRGRLRIAMSGGAPISADLVNRFESHFGTPVLEGYGMTEACMGVSFNAPPAARRGAAGRPMWGVEVEIHDPEDRPLPPGSSGEVCVRGHNLMLGYYNRPDETARTLRGGWLHTGDVGYLDPDGYLFIVGRLTDMIIRGGYNVYPREVEEVLAALAGVREASVVGVPDPVLGEEVVACLSLEPGSRVGEDDVVEWCRARLANYKCPRRVFFLAELPKNTTGKILKRELRAWIDAQPAGEATRRS